MMLFLIFFVSFCAQATVLSIGEYNIDRNGTGTDGWREQGIAPLAELVKVRLGTPDILVLIEVNKSCQDSNNIDGTDYFSKSLGMPTQIYSVEYQVPWDPNKECTTGSSILSKYPMDKVSEISFDKQCCGFGKVGERKMLVAKMQNQNLYVIATHLESGTSDFPRGIYEGFSVRYNQSLQIAKYVQDNIDLNKNCVIITGDLNMIDIRIPYTSMDIPYLSVLAPIKKLGFKDAHQDYQGDKSTVPGTGLSKVLAKLWIPAQLDYILYAGRCSTSNSHIWNDKESAGWSDHALISTNLILNF